MLILAALLGFSGLMCALVFEQYEVAMLLAGPSLGMIIGFLWMRTGSR